jgi:hypothetical protein
MPLSTRPIADIAGGLGLAVEQGSSWEFDHGADTDETPDPWTATQGRHVTLAPRWRSTGSAHWRSTCSYAP